MPSLKLVRADTLPQEAFETLSSPDPEKESEEVRCRGENAPFCWAAVGSEDGMVCGYIGASLVEDDALRVDKLLTRPQIDDNAGLLPLAMLRRYLDVVSSNEECARIGRVVARAGFDDALFEACGFRTSWEAEDGAPSTDLVIELRQTRIVCANAFNNPEKAFSGNPAAVCVLPFRTRSLEPGASKSFPTDGFSFVDNESGAPLRTEDSCEVFMKAVGNQMNLSETAFLRDLGAEEDGKTRRFEIRWKTPDGEVDLCGHATLASTFALWEPRSQLLAPGLLDGVDKLILESRSGELCARRDAQGAITLDFPLETLSEDLPASDAERKAVLRGLEGIDEPQVVFVGRNRMDLVIELCDREAVGQVVPNSALLASVPCRAISISALESTESPYDFVSRLFAPALGVDEDPFCGSAHCYLGPHYGRRLGKTEMRGFMLSKRTGSTDVKVSHETQRVYLRGGAELSWVGMLHSGPFAF
ncbi:Phenazine biosynthesis-like domain-containing protein [Hondaea fermentalgiana]|uniref:Phenazine biosynthesis-like domain-containing protein n=1 Tax=Hondaea fermentalgiana TaxID=2315210 RepID=A0A2R5GJ44_9STRA|nr:Phenazine biosynthesis-like domain-containing protein [Hondaea fermentalgiana]|eukprot:GBG28311.1 Phenazine biosynthesis-like domain-containing protein [Hondaea fermentalgiana]